MPRKPKRPCRKPGCPALVEGGGHCEKHKPKDIRKPRPSDRSTSKWLTYRESFLQKHRWCVVCKTEGIRTLATVLDHVTPHKGDKRLFWKPSNHQALCKRCHDRKTATTDGGWGRTPTQEQATLYPPTIARTSGG
ncbi:MAG: HNH endonuclease [Planctomycetes bacterium]|nr:HNH endonuclease [Planctomycetota bacterium]